MSVKTREYAYCKNQFVPIFVDIREIDLSLICTMFDCATVK